VDISSWIIDDDGGTEKYIISSGIILLSKRCVSFQSGKFNWNTTSGDTVRLLDSNSNLKEKYSYSSAPGEGISIGRVIDGESDLVVLLSSSRDKFNTTGESCLASTPTPSSSPFPTLTPTPASSPTPTPTPSPSTAIYKINEVKDEGGNTLSSVKVYVDGMYTHYYTPEILEFCDGCYCDKNKQVSCGFGQHTIKLKKTGYQDWSKTITINPGTSDEVNPVMSFSQSNPSPTPTPAPKSSTSTSIPTPTSNFSSTPTPKPVKIAATLSGEILGEEESSPGAFYPWEATEEAGVNQESTPSAKNKLLPKIFLGGGFIFLFVAAFWIWYNFSRNYTSR
jgi:hypothetical protein